MNSIIRKPCKSGKSSVYIREDCYIWQCGFEAGGNRMIEKATSWLQEHVNDYLFDDGTPERSWLKCKSDMFDDFKKAMEG